MYNTSQEEDPSPLPPVPKPIRRRLIIEKIPSRTFFGDSKRPTTSGMSLDNDEDGYDHMHNTGQLIMVPGV